MVLRIAVFSDVHGNLTALRAVLAALKRHAPLQMIVAAGDHVLVGPRPAETWDTLQAAGCVCILGNDDELLWRGWAAEENADSPFKSLVEARLPPTVGALGLERMAAMQALPRAFRVVPAAGEDLLIVHANVHGLTGRALSPDMTGPDIARLYGGAHARVICCGHFHAATVRTWRTTTIVNVASVSIPKDDLPLAGYTMLEWDRTWRITQYRVPYDAEAEIRAFADSSIPYTVADEKRL
jgi:predicted phosphodiesterase